MANHDYPDREFRVGEIQDVEVRKLIKHVDARGWLAELFREDELGSEDYKPVMSYLSMTEPGTVRGPHEHEDQADLFCFIGPGSFKLWLWDNRPDSATFWCRMVLLVGQDNPTSVLIPKGVVHAYKCVSRSMGAVINLPNRLYAGEGKRATVDEIRHEDDPDSVFEVSEE
ncbi:MAG: dTDP-4-dehydrorhamnose 3,5-epimerase family protein [Planctomycetota bacterium]